MGHYFISLFKHKGSKGFGLFIQLVWVNIGSNIFVLTISQVILILGSKTIVVTDILANGSHQQVIYIWMFGSFPNNFFLIGSTHQMRLHNLLETNYAVVD